MYLQELMIKFVHKLQSWVAYISADRCLKTPWKYLVGVCEGKGGGSLLTRINFNPIMDK